MNTSTQRGPTDPRPTPLNPLTLNSFKHKKGVYQLSIEFDGLVNSVAGVLFADGNVVRVSLRLGLSLGGFVTDPVRRGKVVKLKSLLFEAGIAVLEKLGDGNIDHSNVQGAPDQPGNDEQTVLHSLHPDLDTTL